MNGGQLVSNSSFSQLAMSLLCEPSYLKLQWYPPNRTYHTKKKAQKWEKIITQPSLPCEHHLPPSAPLLRLDWRGDGHRLSLPHLVTQVFTTHQLWKERDIARRHFPSQLSSFIH